jgi:hypothetical protein
MSITVSLSLNRALKVVERLRALADDTSSKLVSMSTVVSTWSPEDASVRQKQSVVEANFDRVYLEYQGLLKAVGDIRHSLAEANVKYGISALMSEQDALQREVKTLRLLVEQAEADAIELNQVVSVGNDMSHYNRQSVHVMNTSQRASVVERSRRVQSRLHQIADEIASANVNKVSVTLTEEQARLVGLSA